MKFFFLLIYLSIPAVWGFGSFVGEFKTVLESIDNREDMDKSIADWHIIMKRKNRVDKVVDGWFMIKKTISKPWVEFETLIWTAGKFIKMAIDQLTKLSICDDDIKNNFYFPIFVGNATFSDDCILTAGLMKFRKDKEFDVDALVHKVINETFYGKFKIIATVYEYAEDKKTRKKVKTAVGGITVVVSTVRK